MIGAMAVVGENFKKEIIFVPQMLAAARAMKAGVEVLKPYLATGEAGSAGKIILGTVAGDLHDIGKNLVGMMFESAGFEVLDLGVDVPIQTFIDTVNEHKDATIVALSALLTTTMPSLRDTVAALLEQPFRSRIKIMVGGAPITPGICRRDRCGRLYRGRSFCSRAGKEICRFRFLCKSCSRRV